MDVDTREWTDGLLTMASREVFVLFAYITNLIKKFLQ